MALKKKWTALIVIFAILIIGGVFGYVRWRHSEIYVKTNNAYVRGNIYTVAPRVPGKLTSVRVVENQLVKKGDVIAEIDPADYAAVVSRAEATVAEAEAAVASRRAAISRRRADVAAAGSRLKLAEIEYSRVFGLYGRHSIPKRNLDEVTAQKSVAEAALKSAGKAVTGEVAGLNVDMKRIDVAKSALAASRLSRSYCTVFSPVTGRVSRKSAEAGDVVAPGQPICAVVPLDVDDIWIEANYKETQLKRMKPGQKVSLRVDVDKSRAFTGRVESISAGTGAAFSLLPPENATGNWVKVVQRLPVKVKIDPGSDPDHILRLGLSVTCVVDTRSK